MAESCKLNCRLDGVTVSESMCRDRTDKILGKLDIIANGFTTKLDGITSRFSTLTLEIKQHRAWHDGLETQEEKQTKEKAVAVSTAGVIAKWISIGISICGILASAVWYISRGAG